MGNAETINRILQRIRYSIFVFWSDLTRHLVNVQQLLVDILMINDCGMTLFYTCTHLGASRAKSLHYKALYKSWAWKHQVANVSTCHLWSDHISKPGPSSPFTSSGPNRMVEHFISSFHQHFKDNWRFKYILKWKSFNLHKENTHTHTQTQVLACTPSTVLPAIKYILHLRGSQVSVRP